MKIGLVGIGKMGYNLALNIKDKGHQVAAYDKCSESVKGNSETWDRRSFRLKTACQPAAGEKNCMDYGSCRGCRRRDCKLSL